MSGTVKQYVDFSDNTNNDTGANTPTSIQPIVNGEAVNQTVLQRPSESLRQRSEAIKNVLGDSLYLRDADRALIIAGPGKVTWPGSTTTANTGIPVLSDVLWILPSLTPGAAQTSPVPPVASAFGVLHLKRDSDSMDSIAVTSMRRSYAAGDQINVTVSAGAVFSCTLDTSEAGYQRTIAIVATPATTLDDVILALNGLLPTAPDNTQLVNAALEGGALGTDIVLDAQPKQYVAGNFDGEGHAVTPINLAAFFTAEPGSALAEGDTLCVYFDTVTDTTSTGGRRQALPENSNTAVPAGSFFNSRVNPDRLVNALPICKVIDDALVFATGADIPAGSVAAPIGGSAAGVAYAGGSAWADGTTNPATTVEDQLDKIITDLATGDGAAKVRYSGGGPWADGTTNPAATVEAQLDKIISDLAGATGTGKVQGSAVGTDLSAGTLSAQISALVTGWLMLSRNNTVTGANTFSALQTLNGASATASALATTTPPDVVTQRPKPVWELTVDATAGIKLRLYTLYEGGFMFTLNAQVTSMTGSAPNYTIDALTYTGSGIAARCFKLTCTSPGTGPSGAHNFSFNWYAPSLGSPFSDSAWRSTLFAEETRVKIGNTSETVDLDLTDTLGNVRMLTTVRRPIPFSARSTGGSLVYSSAVSYVGIPASTTAYFPLEKTQNDTILQSVTIHQTGAAGGSPTYNVVIASAAGVWSAPIATSVSAASTVIVGLALNYTYNAGETAWLKVTTGVGVSTNLVAIVIGGQVT